jgi:amidophosphoribosyltransferase
MHLPKEQITNQVQSLYEHVSEERISKRIAQNVSPVDIDVEVDVIYQTIEGLHQACPDHTGDWYFSGNYPTPGGNKVVNKAFINFMEGRDERSY